MPEQKSVLWRIVLPAFVLMLMAATGWTVGMPRQSAGAVQLRLTADSPTRYGGIALETIRNAQRMLDSASVENTHGDPVGTVQNVQMNKAGRPQFVRVAFGGFLGIGASVVPLKANTLGYNARDNKVLTDMTRKELEVIAARRSRGS